MALTKVSYSMIQGAQLNVLDFGADPTGVNDSTAAIQAAYNAIPTATVATAPLGGGTVYLPPGKYKISAPLNILNDNVTTLGNGASIIPTHTGDIFVVGPDGQTRQFVVFDSIIVKPIAATRDIVRFESGTMECKLFNCRFEGATNTYTNGYGVNFASTVLYFNNNDVIDGCYFRWLQHGVKDGLAQVNLTIQSSRFSNIGLETIQITTGGVTNIIGCNFESCGQSALADIATVQFGQATGPEIGRGTIYGCHFEENGSLVSGRNFDLYVKNARTILIQSNRFYSGTTYRTKTAIECESSRNVTIINNEYDYYVAGAVNIGSTNSDIVYFGNISVNQPEFTPTGGQGILKLGFSDGNFNMQLGGTTAAKGFAVKDSAGANKFIAFADGSLGTTLANGSSTAVFSSTTKPGSTSGASVAGWMKILAGGLYYWVPAWKD